MDEIQRAQELFKAFSLQHSLFVENSNRISNAISRIDFKNKENGNDSATDGVVVDGNGFSSIACLPVDLLFKISTLLDLPSLINLGMTCKAHAQLIRTTSLWRTLCAKHWRLDPPLSNYVDSHERVILASLFQRQVSYEPIDAVMDEEAMDLGFSWRDVYAARLIGRRIGLRALANLAASHSPCAVTGAEHREYITIGLENLCIDLAHHVDAEFLHRILSLHLVQSALSLCHAEHWQLAELSAHLVALLARYDAGRDKLRACNASRQLAMHLQHEHETNMTRLRYMAIALTRLFEAEDSGGGHSSSSSFPSPSPSPSQSISLHARIQHDVGQRRDRFLTAARHVLAGPATSLPPRLVAGTEVQTRRGAMGTRTLWTLHALDDFDFVVPATLDPRPLLVALPHVHLREDEEGGGLALITRPRAEALWVQLGSHDDVLTLTPIDSSTLARYRLWKTDASTSMSVNVACADARPLHHSLSPHYAGLMLGPQNQPPRLACTLDLIHMHEL